MSDIERRYQEIFEYTPVSLWEQDFTEVYARFEELAAQGVSDIERYFDEHPEVVAELASLVRVIDTSRHSLVLYEASSKEELLGPIDERFDPESYPVFQKQLAAMAAGASHFEAEAYVRTLRGRRVHVLLTVTMLARRQGQVRGLVTLVDISERKRMEDALRQANEVLARSNQELESFAYIASHDLQEPLRMIASYAQLLARRYASKLDERANKYIHYVTDGAKRMQGLISDLLDLSRVGTRGRPLVPTDCAVVLDQVLQGMRVMLREHDARVTHDPLPVVLADASQLAQLFQNLVSNAIKFNREAVPHVHFSAQQQGRAWILAVADNGIGIEEKHRDAIFLAFRRLHARDEYPGTGIGLAIAKKIAERHGGDIRVEPNAGGGSTFYVSLMST